MNIPTAPLRAALLTYHFSDNYGALFQAYALRQWLRQRGIEADFLNYHPAYVEEGGRFDRPWDPRLWRKNLTIAYMKQAHLRVQLFGDRAQRALFAAFRRDHLGVTGPRLRDRAAVAGALGGVAMLVCGSDQIWNPSVQRGLDPVYFLDFTGADHARRVAYAPSFGRSEIERPYDAQLRALVSRIDAISVREATGLDVLERAGVARDCVRVVPDPTILLGGFGELLGDGPEPEDSVFCYALRTDEVIRDVATEAARLTGGPLRGPRTTHQRWSDIGEGIVPGPVEWLQTLAKARIVVSNSFHGVALSVVLNRPFVAVGLPGKRAHMNSRMENLLAVADLEHRLLCDADPVKVRQLAETPIDWVSVNARLAGVRSDGEAYLDDQIAIAKDQTA